ncbi:MAG: TIGR02266 family protein [Myxococcales bacterium]|nr:MAG: TIGR02266 family protein [Myxococcales bacterium]
MADTRKDRRAPVSLKVRFKSATVDQFIEQYSIDISRGGLFIKSKSPMPVGTLLKFEFQLKDESRLIQGVGRVVWMRMPEQASEPDKPPGMGVKFIKMDPQSRALVERIVAPRGQQPAAFETGATHAPPPTGAGRQSFAKVKDQAPFFPSTTPESELPPLEDRTQVRHASQFLASAVAEAGGDPKTAAEAERQAWEARRRSEELERQRAVAAALTNTSSSRPSSHRTSVPPSPDHALKSTGTVAYEDYGGLFGASREESGVFEDESTGVFQGSPSSPVVAVAPSNHNRLSSRAAQRSSSFPRDESPVKLPMHWKPVAFAFAVIVIAGVGLWWSQHDQDSTADVDPDFAPEAETSAAFGAPKEQIPSANETSGKKEATKNNTVQGPTVSVALQSNPTGAVIRVDGIERGLTPITLALPKDKEVTVSFKLPAHATVLRKLTSAKEGETVKVKLAPLPFFLDVTTIPRGATIWALGRHKATPAKLNLGFVRNKFLVRA